MLRPLVLVAVAALALLGAPAAGLGAVQIDEIHETQFEDFDSRSGTVAPTAAQRAAAESLGANVRWNRFGTPQSVIKYGGFLATGIEAAGAPAAALAWLEANADLFGLASSGDLSLVKDSRLVASNGHAVLFGQRFNGVPASPDGFLVVGVVGSQARGWDVAYVSSTLTRDADVSGSAELTLAEAWVEAADAVGEEASVEDVSVGGASGEWIALEVDGLEEGQLVRRITFPTPRGGLVAAYDTTVVSDVHEGHADAFRQVVDAESGEVLFRQSMVDHAVDNPKWKVFPAYPPMTPLNEYPWNYPSADTRDLWCWFPDPACQLVLVGSSPHPQTEWDEDARTDTPTFTTTGNYARSAENWFDPFFPGPTQYQPTSPTRDYVFPWRNVWFETKCNPAVLVPGEGNDIDAATTNLFAMHNRMHNWAYHLGFTEENWNAQEFNYGRPTLENDSLIGMVQAGAVTGGPPNYTGRDNAFMRTLPDGQRSQSGMFLWQPIPGAFYAPCVDGDYDMAVIGHEYTHMIENRMIGKGVRRQGFHAGAMGESYSDFIAMEYLNEYGFVPSGGDVRRHVDNDRGAWAVGAYVTGNPIRAIRNYNMAFPYAGEFPRPAFYPTVNPLNFSDIGYDLTGPQVHADGEIWSATNFDLRELFIDRYPQEGLAQQRECADGKRPAQECPGNRRWIQIVFDAFRLMPPAPSMVDARDAYLAADVMRFLGANQDLLWLGFARRGFGQNAVSNPNDTEPVPSFESPLHEEATLVFTAVAKDEGNAPVANGKVFVGHYEGRVTPSSTTAPGLNMLRIIPDTLHASSRHRAYDFVAQAEGYGHVRFRISGLEPGETRNVTIRFPTNWASRHKGAVATGDGVRHEDLIDDTEATNWGAAGGPVEGRQVLIQLAGERTFDLAKVSAHLRPPNQGEPGPAQNRFEALRAFELYACTATAARPCDPSQPGRFRLIHKSHPDAFPGDNPRPVAPALILRTFEVPRTSATHVLFRVVDNQCTGQESFQGKQDNDPRHETDCRIGTPLPPRNMRVFAAEVQLQSSRPVVSGAQAAE